MLLSALIADAKSVLYVTHEPGRYHKYTPQLAAFKEIGEKAGWKVTVMTGTYDEQLVKLRNPDFGKGYDAIVYNFCFAKSNDLEAANSNYDIADLFKGHEVPKEKGIAWGVIDVHSHVVETVEEVKAGIRRGLEILPPDRLYIDPDCGLKTRTWEESSAKLRVMQQAVHEVRQELGLE